ncbi:MAG: aspartate carbamoyltransferase [Planctomycetota bacterium]
MNLPMDLLPVLEGLHSAEAFNSKFLQSFFQRVEEIQRRPQSFQGALQGRVIATVFFEPSTRTRLSFEAAALRLGGGVVSLADPKASSHSKGETLQDTIRMLGSYADLVVLRHSAEGASRLAARCTPVPVINGGDGWLGHPTQTLVDLATLNEEWGSLEGRTVGVMGDLLHGRTARSLAWGLALLGARMVLLPAPGLDWEPGFEARIAVRHGLRSRKVSHALFRAWTGSPEARLLEPRGLIQPRLFPGDGVAEPLERLDALYLTRLQEERGARTGCEGYPGLLPAQLEDPLLRDCLLLHPLPRRRELPRTIDADPRARYFHQAALGPVVRQALFLAFLRPDRWPLAALTPLPAGRMDSGLHPCPNERCVSRREGLEPTWRLAGFLPRRFLCAWCDAPLRVEYAGCRSTRRLHPVHSALVQRISPENLRPFSSRDGGLAEGYVWSASGSTPPPPPRRKSESPGLNSRGQGVR